MPRSSRAEAVQQVADAIGVHMDEILQLFKPGAKITIIVRPPTIPHNKGDMVLTNDLLDEAITALYAQKHAGVEPQGHTTTDGV